MHRDLRLHVLYKSKFSIWKTIEKLTVTFSAFVVHYLQTIASLQLQRGIIEGIPYPCFGQNIVNISCIFTYVNVCLPKLLERWRSLLILLGHFCMHDFCNGTTFPFISTKWYWP